MKKFLLLVYITTLPGTSVARNTDNPVDSCAGRVEPGPVQIVNKKAYFMEGTLIVSPKNTIAAAGFFGRLPAALACARRLDMDVYMWRHAEWHRMHEKDIHHKLPDSARQPR